MSLSSFHIGAPLQGPLNDPKDSRLMQNMLNQNVGDTIQTIFKIVIAKAKSAMPGEEKQMDAGNSLLQVAQTLQQVRGNDLSDKNLALQKALYKVSLHDLEGHEVEYQNDIVSWQGTPVHIRVEDSAEAAERILQVTNEQGHLVRTLRIPHGENHITWDGCDEADNPLPYEHYTVTATAYTDDKQKSLHTYTRNVIDGVEYDAKGIPHLTAGEYRIDEFEGLRNPHILRNLQKHLNREI